MENRTVLKVSDHKKDKEFLVPAIVKVKNHQISVEFHEDISEIAPNGYVMEFDERGDLNISVFYP